jgi:hypothetical protein
MVGGLKGQCHQIFDFRFSTWISFQQAPDYTIRAFSNLFKKLWRYLLTRCTTRVVHTGGKWKKSEKFSLFLLDTFG